MSDRGNVDATLFSPISHDGWQVRQVWWRGGSAVSQMAMLKAWETFYFWGWNGALPTVDQAREDSHPCMKPIWLSSPLADRALIPQRIIAKDPLQRLKPLMSPGRGRSAALCLRVCISYTNTGTKSVKEPPCKGDWGLIGWTPDPDDLCRSEGTHSSHVLIILRRGEFVSMFHCNSDFFASLIILLLSVFRRLVSPRLGDTSSSSSKHRRACLS